jgi:hypothetical protein
MIFCTGATGGSSASIALDVVRMPRLRRQGARRAREGRLKRAISAERAYRQASSRPRLLGDAGRRPDAASATEAHARRETGATDRSGTRAHYATRDIERERRSIAEAGARSAICSGHLRGRSIAGKVPARAASDRASRSAEERALSLPRTDPDERRRQSGAELCREALRSARFDSRGGRGGEAARGVRPPTAGRASDPRRPAPVSRALGCAPRGSLAALPAPALAHTSAPRSEHAFDSARSGRPAFAQRDVASPPPGRRDRDVRSAAELQRRPPERAIIDKVIVESDGRPARQARPPEPTGG